MINSLIAQASNIKREGHPDYTAETFLALYPQFTGVIPEEVLNMYVDLGVSCTNRSGSGRCGSMQSACSSLISALFTCSPCSRKGRRRLLLWLPLPLPVW